uniref:Uncharacterized protein n=1 Tax=Physcomitrium patens TaxID=3218 RepID=A0A7I4ER13_PHYPA
MFQSRDSTYEHLSTRLLHYRAVFYCTHQIMHLGEMELSQWFNFPTWKPIEAQHVSNLATGGGHHVYPLKNGDPYQIQRIDVQAYHLRAVPVFVLYYRNKRFS